MASILGTWGPNTWQTRMTPMAISAPQVTTAVNIG